jgi:ammonium transporter Rh
MNRKVADGLFYALLLITQIIAAFFYGFYHDHIGENQAKSADVSGKVAKYPKFMDIHIMVYVGIGFLWAYLRRYRLSAITEVFWLSAITVQYYFLWDALFEGAWTTFGRFTSSQKNWSLAEYCAISMTIAFGAFIGKVNNLQMLIATLIGILLYSVNEKILFKSLDVMDMGGSITIWIFGAFYGLGVSWWLNYKEAKESRNWVTNHLSNNFALIGTLFLWCFFPSFNAGDIEDVRTENMAVVNTYFCLIGSLIGAYLTSKILYKGKFHVEHLLNATLVGGIIMGAGGEILQESFVAYIVGGVFGILSALSYTSVSKFLLKIGLHDVSGIFHTFGLPGIIGGLLSSIFRARYQSRGGIQVAGTFISLAISLAGGLLVGLIIRWLGSHQDENEYYSDEVNVHFDDASEYNADSQKFLDKRNRLIFGDVKSRTYGRHGTEGDAFNAGSY